MANIIDLNDMVGWKNNLYRWIYGNGVQKKKEDQDKNIVQEEIAFIWTYGIAKFFAPATVVTRVYIEDKVFDLRNYVKHPKVLDPSKTDSSITIDDCFIKVDPEDKDKFHVKGELEDKGHRLEWNLEYHRLVPQINAMDAESVGWSSGTSIPSRILRRFYDERLSWQIKMPTASVKGMLNLDGKEYTIDTMGYMDSNWGNWFIIDAHWNWMHTFGMHEGMPYAIASVEIRNNSHCGNMYVQTPDKKISFFKNKRELEFEHEDWEKDKATGLQRPVKTRLIGRNLEGYSLELIADNITPYALIQKFPNVPGWIAEWDMLESLVHVYGDVKDPKGDTMIKVDSKGFKEYGATGGILGVIQRLSGGAK